MEQFGDSDEEDEEEEEEEEEEDEDEEEEDLSSFQCALNMTKTLAAPAPTISHLGDTNNTMPFINHTSIILRSLKKPVTKFGSNATNSSATEINLEIFNLNFPCY